ncbi:MAG TPA: vitamin K epoxide reductase family protein, partial [Gammaproteobacteria bacterium]|nr:vitamin K epoxide reductase family protein [Gammaproteobacteria bacterium]
MPAAEPSKDVPLAGAAGLGVVLTTLLLAISMTGSNLPYCGSGSDCDIVQSSRWSMFLGLPLVVWGWGVYAVLAAAALFARKKTTRWRVAIFFA